MAWSSLYHASGDNIRRVLTSEEEFDGHYIVYPHHNVGSVELKRVLGVLRTVVSANISHYNLGRFDCIVQLGRIVVVMLTKKFFRNSLYILGDSKPINLYLSNSTDLH